MNTTTTTTEMTMRQYHEAVIAIPGVPDKVADKARAELRKLDDTKAKRKGAQSKTAKENAPIKSAIVSLLTEKGAMVASAIGEALGITTSKASALCRQLVDEGLLTDGEVKIPKKGKVKQYTAVVTVAEDEDSDVEDLTEDPNEVSEVNEETAE
jgi:predicted transcriptional regulator